MNTSKIRICYSITERNGKSYFNRIGTGFVNSDGSMNLKLDAIPINGEVHVREYVSAAGEQPPEQHRPRHD